MQKSLRAAGALVVFFFLLGLVAWQGKHVAAQDTGRKTTLQVTYTEYEWWLLQWEDNELACQVLIDHEGLPTGEEVLVACGQQRYDQWRITPPCKQIANGDTDTTVCEGLYLHLVSSQPKTKEVTINLPSPVVWVSLEGCSPVPPENRCAELPALVLTGEEPLPNERITVIHGLYGDVPFTCEEPVCKLPTRATPLQGVLVEFWADSSYGDSSEHYTAQVRVIDAGVSPAPGSGGWYVDVASSQWQGAPLASCTRTWQALPPLGGPPPWLSSPDRAELMASDAAYYYLAGRLISQGAVNVSDCTTGGLLPNGYADACGLEKARPLVEQWQNQFDARIIEVAKQTGIPGQLLKNLFAQESQFWPGVFRVQFEFGLGQITDNGADTILLWNPSFYNQFCPLVLSEDACKGGYLHLEDTDKAILRGALALQAKSDCKNCEVGVDLDKTNDSVLLFANTLLANCTQVDQTVRTATNRIPGSISTYEDLWRLTVANYHAGPGCVSYAINTAWQSTGILNWEQVSTRFTEPCKGVVPYVAKITDYGKPAPTPVSVLTPVASPTPSPTLPLPTQTLQASPTLGPSPTLAPATATPTPTATPGTYPAPQPTATTGTYPQPQPTATSPYP